MSLFDGYQFFCVLALILLPALLLGILEQPLKWYSTAATFLFVALTFFPKPTQAMWLLAFFITEMILVKGYMCIRVSRGRSLLTYRLVPFFQHSSSDPEQGIWILERICFRFSRNFLSHFPMRTDYY